MKNIALRRTLIAVALSTLTLSAWAQNGSSVTLYGTLDASLDSIKANGATNPAYDLGSHRRVTNNGSFVGIRGTEDLGGGLKAKFQIETRIGSDADHDDGFGNRNGQWGVNRDSFVGLEAKQWGEVRLGLNTTPYRALGNRLDFNDESSAGSNISLLSRIANVNGNAGFDDRLKSSVVYFSPTYQGVNLSAIYGSNDARRSNGTSNNNSYGLGVNYNFRQLYVGYAYERRNDALFNGYNGGQGSPYSDVSSRSEGQRVGVTYDFKVVKVGAIYDHAKINGYEGNVLAAPVGELKRDAYGITASVPYGRGTFIGQYTKANTISFNGNDIGGTDARMLSVGYSHELSKRTSIRAVYSRINNGSNAGYDFYPSDALNVGAANGSNPQSIGIGLRHSF